MVLNIISSYRTKNRVHNTSIVINGIYKVINIKNNLKILFHFLLSIKHIYVLDTKRFRKMNKICLHQIISVYNL